MSNPTTDKPDFAITLGVLNLCIDENKLVVLEDLYQRGFEAGEAAAVKRPHALSELMANKQRPEIKQEVIAGLREMAEAHHAMAENTQDKLEAAALNAMLDWYEAGR